MSELQEPITFFYEKYGCDTSIIERIISGATFVLILLKNGNIGICATLANEVGCGLEVLLKPDLANTNHRILLNAYFNALLNYRNEYTKTADIFEAINFRQYENNVMIGYFRSLAKKFLDENIKIHIFDKINKDPVLLDMNSQKEYICEADALILTATSIFNGTFTEIVSRTKPDCDVYILGPSSIMHPDMFQYRNIKIIFGSIFKSNDTEVLNLISKGAGTRQILPLLRKVFISKTNY